MELSIKEIDKSRYYLIGLDLITSGCNEENISNMISNVKKHLFDNGINCVVLPFEIRQADFLKEDQLMKIIDEQLKIHLYTDQVSRKDVANAIIRELK